jgi:tungstate transport system substrate-binding protein
VRCLHLAASLLLCASLAACKSEESVVVLATTTSVQDSGLLDALLPSFSEETGVRVQAVAVGRGAALRMGREGNADLLLTHAPSGEQELVEGGQVADRVPFMDNYFVIAGPRDDPAGVGAAASVADALRRVRETGAPWVSRGDDSGTHRKERALWRAAGLEAEVAGDSFTSTGSGMGLSLQVAGERRAYLLSDLGSFLAFRARTGLVALSKPEPDLRNVYSLMRVNPDRFPGRIHAEPARRLQAFFLRPDVQEQIREFGVESFGMPLFRPLHAEPPGEAARD